MNKLGRKLDIYKLLLLTLLIICSIFKLKNIYIEPNNLLEVSLSNILYPFTFLLVILIRNNTNFKETHSTIITLTIIFFIYTILISILGSIPANYNSTNVDLALKASLTPSYFVIFNKAIYFPNILKVLSFSLLFYFSHTIFTILYDAMIPYTKKFIAFSLSMFIPFTLDTICYIVIDDIAKNVEFNKLIIDLTSNFVVVIFSTILISIIYSIKKERSKA